MVNWAVIWMGSDQAYPASKQSRPSIFLEKSEMRLNWFFFSTTKDLHNLSRLSKRKVGCTCWIEGHTPPSSVRLAQPRPQGALPWLWLQSQGKRPGDEVERSPHCTLLAYKGTVHLETDIRYGEIIQIICCSNLIYHKSSIKHPPPPSQISLLLVISPPSSMGTKLNKPLFLY